MKEVVLTDDVLAWASEQVQLLPAVFGKRLGARTQEVIRAHKAGDVRHEDGRLVCGGVPLEEGEYTARLAPHDPARSGMVAAETGVVVLDTHVTAELQAEGLVRDLVRLVQQARRDAGLHVSDRIRLRVAGDSAVRDALAAHEQFVADETLAVSVEAVALEGAGAAEVGEGEPVTVVVEKVHTP